MHIPYSGEHIAEINVQKIRGELGTGFYRLWFHADVTVSALRPSEQKRRITVREFRGEVRVHGAVANPDHLLGPLCPESPVFIEQSANGQKSQIRLYIDLNKEQMEALENIRNGGDLWFRFHWMAIGNGPQGFWPINGWSGLEFQANQSDWLRVLKEMNYGEFLLFEIPIPKEEYNSELRQSVLYLRRARENFYKGEWDKAIGDCRDVLKKLTDGLGDTDEISRAKKMYCARKGQKIASELAQTGGPNTTTGDPNLREEMTAIQRFLFLREALMHVTHLSHHASDNAEIELFDRKDAASVLALTAAITSRYLKYLP
ncbi:MAG TPA: hypothetical protein VK138_05820 [Acidiferrobacterales bacterium]|nr:hypothetical protein [Acidiferrobacterales bacterium]